MQPSAPSLAQTLAETAQRVAVAHIVRSHGELSLGDLASLVTQADNPYAAVIADLRVAELLELEPVRAEPPTPTPAEPLEHSVLQIFRAYPEVRLASSILTRQLGLPRWTAQKVLGRLVTQGKLHRSGRTSSTRYWLATP